MEKWWECQMCGMKYREEISNKFDTCPNCGLELGPPVSLEAKHQVLIDPMSGAFLDRLDAFEHALQCGQLSDTTRTEKASRQERVLFSEDLY